MEAPPLIPDDRADAVLDACPTFESRRAKVKWRTADMIGAGVMIAVAVMLAARL